MAFFFLKPTVFFKRVSPSYEIFCYIRGTRRDGEPKLVKGTIKNTDPDFDENDIALNYKDFVKSLKLSAFVNDVEVEEALNSEEDFGTAIGAKARPNEKEKLVDKDHKTFVKKQIIGRKYFKLDKESTLLTNAAKEQIRYLHRMDPVQWNPETLSQSFPITVSGVKKLLKCNFVLRSPEKIQQHDAEVAKRWSLLLSKTSSPLISSYTQRMWNEGKIMKEHYSGNPNLPNVPPVVDKIIIHQEKEEVGEFSSIIRQYIEYKKSKELPQNIPSTNAELQVSESLKNQKLRAKSSNVLNSHRYHVDDETEDKDYVASTLRPFAKKNQSDDTGELLHSQFKENLKEEVTSRKFGSDPRYAEWMKQQSAEEKSRALPKPVDKRELFSKIPKFNKETFELNREVSKEGENIYYYDEKMGYQHPKGRAFKPKIRLPNNSHTKNTVYKVEQAVYDEDGEFLYKVPR